MLLMIFKLVVMGRCDDPLEVPHVSFLASTFIPPKHVNCCTALLASVRDPFIFVYFLAADFNWVLLLCNHQIICGVCVRMYMYVQVQVHHGGYLSPSHIW